MPDTDLDATTWIYAAIGDAYFFVDYSKKRALEAFLYAYKCPGGTTDPFINLRLGQCYFDLDDKANAEEFLLRPYRWEGKDVFNRDNEKYVNFTKEKQDI